MKCLIVILGSNMTSPHSQRGPGLSYGPFGQNCRLTYLEKPNSKNMVYLNWVTCFHGSNQIPSIQLIYIESLASNELAKCTCFKVWPALVITSLCPTIRYFLALCSKYRSSNKLSAGGQKRRWWLILEVVG